MNNKHGKAIFCANLVKNWISLILVKWNAVEKYPKAIIMNTGIITVEIACIIYQFWKLITIPSYAGLTLAGVSFLTVS